MRWDDQSPQGGFTSGEPWLPTIAVAGGGVASQARDPTSVLGLYKDLIAARRDLGDGMELLDASDGVLAYRRGREHIVAINMADTARPAPAAGSVIRATHATRQPGGGRAPATFAPGEGFLAERA